MQYSITFHVTGINYSAQFQVIPGKVNLIQLYNIIPQPQMLSTNNLIFIVNDNNRKIEFAALNALQFQFSEAAIKEIDRYCQVYGVTIFR